MKAFRKMGLAIVAVLMACLAFTSCDNGDEDDLENIKDLVGTWSYISAGYAEVLKINADGSVVSAGLEGTEDYWDNVNGRIVVADNFISMVFEDNDDFVGQYELVDKETFVLIDVLTGERTTYRYCENDLADEIQGTWKNTGSSWEKNPDLKK